MVYNLRRTVNDAEKRALKRYFLDKCLLLQDKANFIPQLNKKEKSGMGPVNN